MRTDPRHDLAGWHSRHPQARRKVGNGSYGTMFEPCRSAESDDILGTTPWRVARITGALTPPALLQHPSLILGRRFRARVRGRADQCGRTPKASRIHQADGNTEQSESKSGHDVARHAMDCSRSNSSGVSSRRNSTKARVARELLTVFTLSYPRFLTQLTVDSFGPTPDTDRIGERLQTRRDPAGSGALRTARSGRQLLALGAVGDFDAARLCVLCHRDGQGENPGLVLGLNVFDVEIGP